MAKREAIYDIEHCYANGDLAIALEQAAQAVREIGEKNVVHVISYRDENISDAWWVDVVYRVKYDR